MPTYVFTYRAPKGYERTPESAVRWRGWFDQMRDSVVELGNPAVSAAGLGNVSSDSTELGGYSLIEATNLKDALAKAAGCPYLDENGGIELAELIPVPAAVPTAAAGA